MALSQAEKNVFGADAGEHPVTGMAIEKGRGSLPEDQQAYMHCDVIQHQHGKHAAEQMRARVKAHIDARTAIEKDETFNGHETVQHLMALKKSEE